MRTSSYRMFGFGALCAILGTLATAVSLIWPSLMCWVFHGHPPASDQVYDFGIVRIRYFTRTYSPAWFIYLRLWAIGLPLGVLGCLLMIRSRPKQRGFDVIVEKHSK